MLVAVAPIAVRMALGVLNCKTASLPAADAAVLFAWNRRQPYPSAAALFALAATSPPPVTVLVNVAQPFYVCYDPVHVAAAVMAWVALAVFALVPPAIVLAGRVALLNALLQPAVWI